MMDAINQEIVFRKDYLRATINTIYFGGGTPSLIPIPLLEHLMGILQNNYNLSPNAEITLESNPDDINEWNLAAWKMMGINRLSIGIQSFSEHDLQWMNRAHTADQALQSILLAKAAGFEQITIDLIYGTPVLTDAIWKNNVQIAIDAGITHLSCYALTVEPKTGLEKLIAKKQVEAVDPDKQAAQFTLLMGWMAEAGFEHYEISNFAVPGCRSKHNSSYWTGEHYLGIGPSAHSFNGSSRQWNIANNSLYIQSISKGTIPFEMEILTTDQQLNEYIMTSLRTMEGLSLTTVTHKWGDEKANKIIQESSKHINLGYAKLTNNQLCLTSTGKLMADGIASDLFF